MQQTHAKRKVGGKHNRKFERRSRNRQPHTAASSFRLCGFHRKNHKETIPAHKIWISSIAQSMFCKLWSSPLAQVSESGASLTCWKDTETTIRGLMLMYGREAQSKTRIASPATIPKQGNHKAFSPLFRRIILWYNLKYRAVRKTLV